MIEPRLGRIRGLPPWYMDLAPPAIAAVTLVVAMVAIDSIPWWWMGVTWALLGWSFIALVRARRGIERSLRALDAMSERCRKEHD